MDLKIAQIVDILPVLRVDLTAMSPPLLILTGVEFHKTHRVVVNDQDIPKRTESTYGYTILSPSSMRVELPMTMTESLISTILIYGSTSTLAENSAINFVVSSFTPLTGITKVAQQFLRLLLASPGTDLFSPTEGGGLGRMAGVTLTDTNFRGISAQILAAVKKCVQEIRGKQILSAVPATERLVDILVIDLSTDSAASTIDIQLEIQTEVQQAVIKLGV